MQRLATVCLVLAMVVAGLPLRAQSLIRDAEIEYALRELARPVLSAAGLNAGRMRVLVINDSSLNAFVADQQNIFIHSGLILKLDRPEELQAVIAHEAAHIANGHITRRLSNMRSAKTAAGLGLILSAAAAAGGNSQAAGGIAIGAASSAQRVLFGHTRAEEASADHASARYMASAGIDPQAMVDVLDIFSGQVARVESKQDPYMLTHPLTRDRLRTARGYASAYKGETRSDPASAYWFARAQGKLSAFLRNPGWTLRRIAKSDTSDTALMRRAVAYHRSPKPDLALKTVNALIARRPDDGFAHELKGQILLESRQPKAAVAAYARAVSLAPREPLILAGYGRALLAAGQNGKALTALEKARARDPRDPRLLRDLALAYAKAGKPGMASLATAERYALAGRLEDAGLHAKRATGLLPRGGPAWNRAQDVLIAAEAAKKRR